VKDYLSAIDAISLCSRLGGRYSLETVKELISLLHITVRTNCYDINKIKLFFSLLTV